MKGDIRMAILLKSAPIAIVAALLMSASAFGKDTGYFPVARVTTGEGYKLSVVQPSIAQRDACAKANTRFTDTLKSGCPSCKVEAAQCRTKLTGKERDAAAGKAVPEYVVTAGAVKILVTGKKAVAKSACEQLAASLKGKDLKDAACIAPAAAAR